MNAFTALLMGALPVVLFAWIGSRIHTGKDAGKDAERWLLFLLSVITVLLTGMIISILSFNNRISTFSFIFLPCLWGAIAATLLHFFSGNWAWPRDHLTWSLFVIILVLFVWLGFAGEPSIVPIVVFGGMLTALVWRAWGWVNRWTMAAYPVLMLLLLLALWSTDTARSLFEHPAWLASIVNIGLALVPGAAIIVAARLVQAGFGSGSPVDWPRLMLSLVSVALILFLLGYQVMLASIWDVATDGLSGIFLVGLTSLAGIASALILIWKLPGRRKLAAILFAALVPVTMISAERLGTFDREGKWGTLPIQVTAARAEKIDMAIKKFHAENEIYPQTLSELTPRYLLYVPVPYMIREQDWCYEGGRDYYRFGYVYREMFSLPASVRLHAAQGEPPDSEWECDEEARKYQ
jgi:hypothetical protein